MSAESAALTPEGVRFTAIFRVSFELLSDRLGRLVP
jgi:hypothetical protein